MSGFRRDDLCVVIPTVRRWPTLRRTLDALVPQLQGDGEVLVVVDGAGEEPPAFAGVRVLQQDHAGPGAARNRGVAATQRPLVLLLGDDMVPAPGLVDAHIAGHDRRPAREDAFLGHVDWHPEVADNAILRWMERSGTQFDFATIDGEDAGWPRFYSCNVSLKRELLLAAGGFDESFRFDYEDLDLAWRLHNQGLRLWYVPDALVHHHHSYDWAGLTGRFRTKGEGERQMAAKHEWFTPFYEHRVHGAAARRRAARVWPRLADRLPSGTRLARLAEERADLWYHQQLAPWFLRGWEGGRDLEELRAYLGDRYDYQRLVHHAAGVEREEEAAPDEETFYRTSEAYLYDLTAFAMSGTKDPYLHAFRRAVPTGSRVLDYGCGIGSDGLRLIEAGYHVDFADFDNPSTAYLRWRLAQRGVTAPVHDIDVDVPAGYDAAYSLDVIEHVEDPYAFLAQLERRADVVMVNFLEPDPADVHLHRPLPIPALLDRAATGNLLHYRVYHGRSHLVIYRPRRGAALARARGRALVALGPRLPAPAAPPAGVRLGPAGFARAALRRARRRARPAG